MEPEIEKKVHRKWQYHLPGLAIGLLVGIGVTWLLCHTKNPGHHGGTTIIPAMGPCETALIANNNNGVSISDQAFGNSMTAFQNDPSYRVVPNGNQRLGLYGARIGTTALQNIICLANASGDSAVYVRLGLQPTGNPNASLTYFMFTGLAPANATRLYYRNNGTMSMCPINCMIPPGPTPPRL